jgi:hypothetical protein
VSIRVGGASRTSILVRIRWVHALRLVGKVDQLVDFVVERLVVVLLARLVAGLGALELLDGVVLLATVVFAAGDFEAVDRDRVVALLRAGAERRFGTLTYSTARGLRSINALRMPIE